MTKNHILGIDVAQNGIVAQLDQPDGTRCWHETFKADATGWETLDGKLTQARASWPSTRVVLEATGNLHLPWAERLHAAQAQPYVLNPLLASRLHSTRTALRGHKSDEVDSDRLCEIGRLYPKELERFRYRPDHANHQRKQLLQTRAAIRGLLTNAKKNLLSQLQLVFPAVRQAKIDPTSARGLRLLHTAGTAAQWLALPLEQRQELAGSAQDRLDQASHAALLPSGLAEAGVAAIRLMLDTIEALAQQVERCDQQIASLLPVEKARLIASIPGFGPQTTAVFATYVPDHVIQSGSAKQVVARLQAFFGTDPRVRRSGQWEGQIRISKRGVCLARTALFQAAFCAVTHDPECKGYYQSLRGRGKPHKQAIVDLMRKQLRRLVAVLRSNQPFTPRLHAAKN